ncbi:uncharacterized protein K460DRAFT_416323 [Cucurbitaria berberidis CBS 394.84]|uniref:Uncharacterized protein n=1 Tax=Cucurbitaria berberidis CBS 394.84 TaxID=1168544 RepID=A0A9P4L853_9PLEO|nr:uncharacterized protein K460DRAFT_416323 [Cucurbitaria berberidis CBS 394.84]KAF1844987.1 hypothetical protein K460DRAFT_416323 [Cucurbitaria berberidis CBS 394.84]
MPTTPADIKARREYRQHMLSRIASPVVKTEPVSPTYRPSTPVFLVSSHQLYSSETATNTGKTSAAIDSSAPISTPHHRSSPRFSKEKTTPKAAESPRLKLKLKRTSDKTALTTPGDSNSGTIAKPISVSSTSDSTSSSGSGLKLKLRGIQAALKEPHPSVLGSSPLNSKTSAFRSSFNQVAGRKRSATESTVDDEDDTDSEIELFPSKPRRSNAVKKVIKKDVKHTSPIKTKKMKTTHFSAILDDDAMFDAGDEDESRDDDAGPQLSLVTPVMKRNKRILDIGNPEHKKLIDSATKVGADYYDSDADDLPGNVKDTSKPHLFRNVKWGAKATDYANAADFADEPEFTQFVPGRFELQPDGTLADQKAKLIIKLTDKSGRQRIFTNPPPRDWNNQEAITALNKRTVQQIRRNTNVRFREVVHAYVAEERGWILANLTNGKPTKGWKPFVEEFNKRFEGTVVHGVKGTRPYRSHSSLTKEVERFGPQFYAKGLVPVTAKKGKKE